MKKIFGLFFLVASFVFLIGCDKEPQVEVPTSINYSTTEVTIEIGETFTFDVEDDVSFLNGNSNVVSLDKTTGTIEGLASGTAVITIYLKNYPSVKIEVTVTVPAIESYTISYDLDGGTCTNLVESFQKDETVTLPTPTKERHSFIGWFEGENVVTTITNKNYQLKAKWEQVEFSISYDLGGGKCDNLVTSFDKDEVVTLPTPTKDNSDFFGWYENDIKVETITNKDYVLVAKWEEVPMPENIEIFKSVDEEYIYSDTDLVLSCVVYPEGASQEVTWRALNRTKATIDDNRLVTVVANGSAEFQVTSVADRSVTATITLEVRNHVNPYDFMDSIQIANPVAKVITAYSSTAGYKTYLLGGVINYLFENIAVKDNFVPVGQANRPGTTTNGITFSARYVTYHDVGATGNATANSNYCKTTTAVSWHYTVGNDGIYQQLPLNEIGWHAGDGTTDPLVFYDSGISAPAGDDTPATITVNQVTGKFMVNGVESNVTAPLNSEDNRIVLNSQLPYTGINNYVDEVTGHYMIGKTYWNTTYNVLSNRGGNLNSIGIESTIDSGSNIYYTWELSAKLISTIILPKTGLLPRDVKQHNTFSGKNCPQTMRTAGMWENFMDLIESEYIIYSQLYNYKFTFICDSPYLNSNGMIKSLPDTPTEVSYSIRMVNTSDSIDHTFNYKVTLPASSSIAIA